MTNNLSLPNLRIVPRNYHDDATLTTQLQPQPGHPVEATQNTDRDSTWQGDGIATQYVRGVFPKDGFLLSFFGLFNHNVHGGTVQLELFNQDDWTGQVYDSGELDTVELTTLGNFPWGTTGLGIVNDPFVYESPLAHFIFANSPPNTGVATKSYQITFRDTMVQTRANPNWEVGRIWLGEYFEVSINPAYGAEIGFADNADKGRTRSGNNRSSTGAFWRSMLLDLSWILEADRTKWMYTMRQAMTARDVVAILFPEDPDTRLTRDYVMAGKFASLDPLGRQVGYMTKKFVIEEN